MGILESVLNTSGPLRELILARGGVPSCVLR